MARISTTGLAAACVTAVTALVLAGCGAGAQSTASPIEESGSTGTSATSAPGASGTGSADGATDTHTDTRTDTSPPVEPSGTEAARTQGPAQPSADLAGLPIGDARPSSLSTSARQCLSVRYLEQIPQGVRIRIVGAGFDPKVATVGGDGCSGRGPACLGGFAFDRANIQDDARCVLPITLTGMKTPDDDGESSVTFRGEAVCPTGQESVCQQLHEDYAGDRSLSVGLPDELIGSSPSDSSDSSSSSHSPAPADSSSGSSDSSSGS